jgi:hypothetical protein
MGIKPIVVDAVLWALLCVMTAIGLSGADSVGQYSPVSLRYDTPISGQTAYNARKYSVSHSGEDVFWPVFWHEYTAKLKGEFTTFEADCIAYSGDSSLVWPLVCVAGAAPGVVDGTGCAVSEPLAWKLWGSIDVVGMTVEIDGVERLVRGVFEGESELAMISFRDEDVSQSWSAVELSGGPADAVRDDAVSYAAASGLGRPSAVLMGGYSYLTGTLAILPVLILAVYGLALICRLMTRRSPGVRAPLFFICLIALAVILPGLLGLLPAWMIPTRWSDLSFWSTLLRKATDGVREFLRVAPRLRDVELRMLIIKQIAIAFVSICVAVAVCFRWQARRVEKGC